MQIHKIQSWTGIPPLRSKPVARYLVHLFNSESGKERQRGVNCLTCLLSIDYSLGSLLRSDTFTAIDKGKTFALCDIIFEKTVYQI